jgi:hypothetical protein
MTFSPRYFLWTIAIFAVELLIALFVHDKIIRPYIGDLLVVVLVYAFVRTFFKMSVKIAAFGSLAFAFLVEFLQYLQIVDRLGLAENRVVRIVIGTSFSWEDLAMYSCGFLVVILTEKRFQKYGTTSV